MQTYTEFFAPMAPAVSLFNRSRKKDRSMKSGRGKLSDREKTTRRPECPQRRHVVLRYGKMCYKRRW